MAVLEQHDLFELRVSGVSQGQSIINTFWYFVTASDPTITLEGAVLGMQANYRSDILPLLHDSFQVLAYTGRTVGNIISRLGPTGVPFVPPRLAMRFKDQHAVTGGVLDVGGAIGNALPTYVAVGARKVLGGLKTIRNTAVVDGYKLPKGSVRFGPFLELETQAATPNALEVAYVADWVLALEVIRLLTGGTTFVAQMCVIQTKHDGIPWMFGTPAVLEPVLALVSSFQVNPFATSQVSRKASLANLG